MTSGTHTYRHLCPHACDPQTDLDGPKGHDDLRPLSFPLFPRAPRLQPLLKRRQPLFDQPPQPSQKLDNSASLSLSINRRSVVEQQHGDGRSTLVEEAGALEEQAEHERPRLRFPPARREAELLGPVHGGKVHAVCVCMYGCMRMIPKR